MVLQADGIEPVGRTNWVDGDSGEPLLLLYFDRPAIISGRISGSGKPLRYCDPYGRGRLCLGWTKPGADENVYSVRPRPHGCCWLLLRLDSSGSAAKAGSAWLSGENDRL